MKTDSKSQSKDEKKGTRREGNRQRLSRLLKQALAGELSFASAAILDNPGPVSYRRTIE